MARVPGRPDVDRRRARDAVEGSVLIHEWMFENRLVFTDKLVLMGADITLCDPHRAIVSGPRSCAANASSRRTSAPAWRC